MSKKLKDTKFFGILKNLAPKAGALAANLLPDSGVLGIVKNLIDNEPNISDAEKKRLGKELLEFEKLEMEDRAGARDMQKAALDQDDLFSKRFVYYLATFWSAIGAIYIFATTFFDVLNPKVADTVLGFLLGTIVATVINFFFGSSQGSKDKTKQLGK